MGDYYIWLDGIEKNTAAETTKNVIGIRNLGNLKSRLNMADMRIHDLDYRSETNCTEISPVGTKKMTNQKTDEEEAIFKDIIGEYFPELIKNITLHIREA